MKRNLAIGIGVALACSLLVIAYNMLQPPTLPTKSYMMTPDADSGSLPEVYLPKIEFKGNASDIVRDTKFYIETCRRVQKNGQTGLQTCTDNVYRQAAAALNGVR